MPHRYVARRGNATKICKFKLLRSGRFPATCCGELQYNATLSKLEKEEQDDTIRSLHNQPQNAQESKARGDQHARRISARRGLDSNRGKDLLPSGTGLCGCHKDGSHQSGDTPGDAAVQGRRSGLQGYTE